MSALVRAWAAHPILDPAHEQGPLRFDAGDTSHVVATCSCGTWRGPRRRPEDHHGDTAPWVADWRTHVQEETAPMPITDEQRAEIAALERAEQDALREENAAWAALGVARKAHTAALSVAAEAGRIRRDREVEYGVRK